MACAACRSRPNGSTSSPVSSSSSPSSSMHCAIAARTSASTSRRESEPPTEHSRPESLHRTMEFHMKYGKKIAVAALAALTVLSLAGCATGKGDTPAAGDKPADKQLSIDLVSKGFQHQFWQAVKTGAEEKGKELGVKINFEGPGSETEIEKQLQMLQSSIDRKPDAIAYAALDPEACIPALDSAEAAGIPVAYFDAPCNSEVGKTLAATDSKVAGALAAEHMAELIGGAGEVAIVAHSQINSTGVERRDGFVEKVKADYPDITIVDIQYGDGDHLK